MGSCLRSHARPPRPQALRRCRGGIPLRSRWWPRPPYSLPTLKRTPGRPGRTGPPGTATRLLQAVLREVGLEVGVDVTSQIHPAREEVGRDAVQVGDLARVLDHQVVVDLGPRVVRLARIRLVRR